ncbi:hypothetical protein FBU59_003150 [Linderina macrospora]|uniref:Uncharacterized protein n=1 Tax=Linderina macrospora TaxID=4868 RepID=A0ACC1J937_9FUNG|nr:hypothetical protein FBU59_003150 [Linderina macrospora]
MAAPQNALATAFDAYASDNESGSDTASSKDGHTENTAAPLVQYGSDDNDDEVGVEADKDTSDGSKPMEAAVKEVEKGEDKAEDSPQDSDTTPESDSSTGYRGIDADTLSGFRAVQCDLDSLLGCDKVPDFAPQSNPTPCALELTAKFNQWHALKQQGANYNAVLARNRTLRNPNIYDRLVDHLNIQETGSNLQVAGFEPETLQRDFDARVLAEEQERRARESAVRRASGNAGINRRIEFQPASQNPPQTLAGTSNKAFSDALQRAQLIAQHLSRPSSSK